MSIPEKASRKGRELKPAAVRKRHNIAFRVNDELRAALQSSADAAQRSVSEEIEFQLQRARDVGVILDLMFSDIVTGELFRTLSTTLRQIRYAAAEREFDEKETRAALKVAYDHIGQVYFWTGGEIPYSPADEALDADERQRLNLPALKPAGSLGFNAAENTLTANRDRLQNDLGLRIADYWSGDGSSVQMPEDEPTKSLSKPTLKLASD